MENLDVILNRNRRITFMRNVVERLFGRAKNIFEMLKYPIPNARIPLIRDIFRSHLGIINAYKGALFKDSPEKWDYFPIE